jgi:CRISPR system Cascade subunit CasC
MELTAGLFYGYVVVDVPALVSNLEGCPAEDWTNADRALAGKVVHNLVNLIATVTPGAKRGSTAPYSYADLTLIEAGARQPRSLANAYRKATTAQTEDAAQRLAEYLGKLDDNYGAHEARRVTSVDDHSLPKATRLSLDDLAAWVQQAVVTGQAV